MPSRTPAPRSQRALQAAEAAELWSVLALLSGGLGAVVGGLMVMNGIALLGFLVALASLASAGLWWALLKGVSVIAEDVAVRAEERTRAVRNPS